MIPVVLDTNVIVSALLRPGGTPATVLRLAAHRVIQLCVCDDVYAEYRRILPQSRLRLRPEVVAGMLEAVRGQSRWVQISERVRGASDPDDDIFLACASSAGADYLVTGNLKHFPSLWGRTKIVSPRAFLAEVLASDRDK